MPLSLSAHRLQLYGVFSTLMASAVIASAFHKHSNFYSATVFLSRSSASVMVLANYGGFLTLLFGRVVQQIFFGRLSTQEVERLYDRTWFFLTESLLAFTIFRDEFDAPFVVMFAGLLFLKCFHWLIADRMDWMDQQPYPGPPWLFHIRTNIMFFLLWTIDILMLDFAVESVLAHGVGGIILFGSEYAILLASVLNSALKYCVMVYDLHRARSRGGENAPVWENKSMYMFYIELFTDFLKLTTYLAFFTIVMTYFGLPLNIIRDVYMTGASFYTRFRDLLRYRAATKDMETKYPDATEEELNTMNDRTCIICREEMTPTTRQHQHEVQQQQQQGQTENQAAVPAEPLEPIRLGAHDPPKKLPCGHVFHFQCLRSWLERQQSCPTCRRSVLENTGAPPTPVAGARVENGVQAGVNGNGNGDAPAAAPGAVPQPPAAPAPTAAATRRRAGANANANNDRGTRSRSPAPHAQPRAFQGFSVGGQWHSWAPTTSAPTPTTTTAAPPTGMSPATPNGRGTGTGGAATPVIETALLNTGGVADVESGSSAATSVNATPTRQPVDLPPTPIVVPAIHPNDPRARARNESESTSQSTPTSPPPVATTSQTQTPEQSESGLTPREAAAAAALRRLGGMAKRLAPNPRAHSDIAELSSPAPVPSTATPASAATTQPIASSSIPTLQPTPPTPISNTNATPSSSSSAPMPTLPSLIPLFDPSSIAHRPFINLSNLNLGFQGFDVTPVATPSVSMPSGTYSTGSINGSGPTSFPWGVPSAAAGGRHSNTPLTATPARVPSFSSFVPSTSPVLHRPTPTRQQASQLSPLEIPSILTEFEQHQSQEPLDGLTVEAIDERLKALEEVQQSLFRAAEELRRVRDLTSPSSATTQKSAVDVKGKGRAVFDVSEDSHSRRIGTDEGSSFDVSPIEEES